MHPIFLQLETDHQRMQRMLYDLNHQIESYFGLHDAPADVDAMMRCLDYIQIYPEVWHHPVEDIIFRQLLTKPGAGRARRTVGAAASRVSSCWARPHHAPWERRSGGWGEGKGGPRATPTAREGASRRRPLPLSVP